MPVTFACPTCSTEFTVPPSATGTVRCGNCNQLIQLPDRNTPLPPKSPDPEPVPPDVFVESRWGGGGSNDRWDVILLFLPFLLLYLWTVFKQHSTPVISMAHPLIWGAIAAGAYIGGKIIDSIPSVLQGNDVFSQLGDVLSEVTVTVTGNPRSNKRQLTLLAAATAFGCVKNIVLAGKPIPGPFGTTISNPAPSPGMIGVTWNEEEKEVTYVVRYRQTFKAIVTVGEGKDALGNFPPFGNIPDQVVGAPFDFTGGSIVNFPQPPLEFAGKTILTDRVRSLDPDPSVKNPKEVETGNPRPCGDARSRGSLVNLVWQALTSSPESNVGTGSHTYKLPTNDNRFTGG